MTSSLSHIIDRLTERVEAATEPDRVLFLEVAQAVGQINADAFPHSDGTFWWADGIAWGRIPDLFNSLDAAKALLPEGMTFYVDAGTTEGVDDCHASVWSKRDRLLTGGCKKAVTPALALTAACLRARSTLQASSKASDGEGGE